MRSKCEKIERLLSDYIDQTLSERKTAEVASHLRECDACRREAVALTKTNRLLQNFYVRPEASDAYYARFTTRLQQRVEEAAPTAFHQHYFAAGTRLGWRLLTQLQRRVDDSRLSDFLSIKRHAFAYYMIGLTLAMLVVAPLLLNQISPQDERVSLFERIKTQFLSTEPIASVQPTAALTIKQERAVVQPVGVRRNVSSGRTTELPAVDSGVSVWEFTDEPMTEGYIFVVRQRNNPDTLPSVALDIDSELLAYAELPAHGTFWEQLTGRDVLTESRYAVLLLKGMGTGQHAHQQYKRKWSRFKGFSQKLLEVPLEVLSIPDPYDSKEL